MARAPQATDETQTTESATDEAATPAATPGKQTIKIQGFSFEVPAPYTEGHVLVANEAAALNQMYGENIRNNSASRIKAILEAVEKAKAETPPRELTFDIDSIGGIAGTKPTEGNTKTLRQSIDEYASTYVFGARVARSSEPTDPVEREAYRIGRDTISEALRAKNIKVKDLPEGQYDAAIKAYSAQEHILAEARRRVEARAEIGKGALDLSALGLGTPATPAPAEPAAAEG